MKKNASMTLLIRFTATLISLGLFMLTEDGKRTKLINK